MAFDTRDLRIGMDVYTADWVYLGTVRRIRLGLRPARDQCGLFRARGAACPANFSGHSRLHRLGILVPRSRLQPTDMPLCQTMPCRWEQGLSP